MQYNHKLKLAFHFFMKKVLLPQKWSFLFWAFLALILFVFWYTTFYLVFSQIHKMDNHFFETSVEKIKVSKKETHYRVSYKLTASRPADWAILKSLPKYLPQSFVVSEDSFFYKHPGYDLTAMQLALKEAVTQKKKLRGGSTINQQLAKNLFLSHERSLGRKGLELIYAVYMNKLLKKSSIMEHYLNVIEYGPGLYGIGKASRFYFKKSPSQLSPKEAAFLAMLLPNPKKYSQSYRMKKLSRYARKSIQRTLRKLVQTGHISKDRYIAEVARPLSFEMAQLDDMAEFLVKSREEVNLPVDEVSAEQELGDLAEKEESEVGALVPKEEIEKSEAPPVEFKETNN